MKFKILCIDGGGIKGLYSSTILEHLEEKYGGSCSDYFDMICGTSTGGLIALGISQKIPAAELSKIYSEHGKDIFPKQGLLKGILKQTFLMGKYKDDALKQVLQKVFGDRLIGESNNLLCIPSYSLTDARPWIFKYDHKEGELVRDNKVRYVDVALATSAAPTFLPIAEIGAYDDKQFIDGGVWANDPSLIGLLEALNCFVGEGKQYDEIQLLSISSLNTISGKPIGLKRYRSFIHWREELFETSMIGQSHFTSFFLSKIQNISSVPVEYVRIPSESISADQKHLVQLDGTSLSAIKFIRGKGNDRGLLAAKDPEIAEFFKTYKTYKTN